MDVIFFIYGLAFMAMGLVIVICVQHDSQLALANILWLLAAFGFSHGFLEWTELWWIVRGDNPGLAAIRPAILLISYLFLFEFGRRLARLSLSAAAQAKPASRLLSAWIYAPLLGGIMAGTAVSDQPALAMTIGSRYLAGFFGSGLVGMGFHFYWRNRLEPIMPTSVHRAIRFGSEVAAAAFIAYAILGGLVVPRAEWFPASVINQENFLAIFAVPVQLLRAACAVLVAVAVAALQRIFYFEAALRLRDALTERKEALATLQGSEEEFRVFATEMTDGIFMTDDLGAMTFANQALIRICGFERLDQLVGRRFMEFIAPPMLKEVATYFRQVVESELPTESIVVDLMRPDGTQVGVEISAVAKRDGHKLVGTQGILRDITERRSAEQRFRDLFNRASDGIMIFSPSGKILAVNASFARMHGYSVEEMLNLSVKDLDIPEAAKMTAERMRCVGSGESVSFEVEHYHKDGHIFPLEVSANLIVSGGEKVIQGFHRDITERKWMEQATNEREAALREAQRIAGIGSWEHTLGTDAVTWSEGLHLILGRDFSLGPPTFATLPRYYTPGSWERLRAAIARAIEAGASYEIELEMIRDDGTTCWVTTRGEAVRAADGAVVKLRGTVHDIDARKRMEQAQKDREVELREAQRIAGIGSWEWIPVTDTITWSEGLCLILGHDPDFPAPTFDKLAHYYTPESWERLQPAVARALETGAAFGLELETIREDGTTCWTMARGEAVRAADGAVVKLRGTVHDIDARKRAEVGRAQLEAQLRESQKMEALGTLAGGIAHDFNNIIAAISGNLELARQDLGHQHAALESLEEIRKASRRAKDLVQQILAFGRRQGLSRKVISLAPVVEETARLLRTTLLGGVTLNVECADETPAVLADATQIQQLLLNLCNNAWQAMRGMGQPGVIEIRLEAHHVDAAPYAGQERRSEDERVLLRPGRYACLTVRDNGPGMDDATRSRMFEPFYTTKPVGEGTGLGLAVVYGIVQAHEGRIAAQSEPGRGATFSIYFPAVNAPVVAVAEQELFPLPENTGDALVLQGAGKHILYVDDDDAIVFLMTRLLERQGYRVSGYTDAREALAAVRAEPAQFDLAVTDYNMPGMSGLDVARSLRELRADLPVVLASGYITEELRALAPAAGVRELIFKPNTVEELCGVVARLASAEK